MYLIWSSLPRIDDVSIFIKINLLDFAMPRLNKSTHVYHLQSHPQKPADGREGNRRSKNEDSRLGHA